MALTEAGKRAAEGFDGSSADNPRLRCEPTNILFDWTFDTLVNRITQSDAAIRMQYGFMGLTRTIHLDVTEHPAVLTPSVAGHSIGRWEGDVLVVDTVGFAPGVLSADAVTMHSDQLRIVERFALDSEAGALRRTYVARIRCSSAGSTRAPTTCSSPTFRTKATTATNGVMSPPAAVRRRRVQRTVPPVRPKKNPASRPSPGGCSGSSGRVASGGRNPGQVWLSEPRDHGRMGYR